MDEPIFYDTDVAVAIVCRETQEQADNVRIVLDLEVRFMELAGIAECSEPDFEALAQERQLHADLLPEPDSDEMDRDEILEYLRRTTKIETTRLARIMAAEQLYMEQIEMVDPGAHDDYLAWAMEVAAEKNGDLTDPGHAPSIGEPDRHRARILSYFTDYKNEPLVCPECGWRGTWVDGAHEYFDSLVDCSCPARTGCSGPILAIVPHPTVSEYEENRARLSAAEQAFGDAQVAFQKDLSAKSLQDSSQLPDLEDEALDLEWDQEGRETVLRNADMEIWREPAVWDGYQRFLDVLAILKARYGPRLRDLKPTAASMDFLLGDNVSASSILADARAGILANDPLRRA